MKKKMLLGLVFDLFLFSNMVYAQKPNPFTEKTADVSKINVKMDFPAEGRTSKNGSGYSANVDLLNPKPSKVALVSFYLYDPACGETKGGVVTGHASAAAWRTPDAIAQTHIDGFYRNSIDALKAGFKEFNIELLTPEEFANTEEKAEFYYTFNQETAKKEKTDVRVWKNAGTGMSTIAEASVSTIKISPTGMGYRAFFVTNEAMNKPAAANFINTGIGGANRMMTSSLGYELCKGLGVDAVVVCYIVTRKPNKKKDDYTIDAANLFMFGPNPMASGPDDKNRGQFYCGTRYLAGQVIFQSEKNVPANYDHMDNVMTALSKKMCNWVINRQK